MEVSGSTCRGKFELRRVKRILCTGVESRFRSIISGYRVAVMASTRGISRLGSRTVAECSTESRELTSLMSRDIRRFCSYGLYRSFTPTRIYIIAPRELKLYKTID